MTDYINHKLTLCRRNFFVLFTIYNFILYAITILDNHLTGNFVIAVGIINLLLYSYIFIGELKYGQQLHFAIFYYIMAIQSFGIGNIFQGIRLNEGFQFNFGGTVITDFIPIGAVFANFEFLLVFMGYYYILNKTQKKRIQISSVFKKINTSKYFHTAMVIYIITILYDVLVYLDLNPFQNIGIISHIFNNGILIAMMYLVYDILSTERGKSKHLLYFIMAIGVAKTMFGDSKEAIILNFVPYFIMLFYRIQEGNIKILSPKIIIRMSAFMLLMILVIFPIVTTTRVLRNLNDGVPADVNQVIETYFSVLASPEDNSVYRNDRSITDEYVSRNYYVAPIAYALKHVESRGYIGSIFIEHSLMALVPRILWPEKPVIAPGMIAYDLTLGGNGINPTNRVFVNFGFIGATYMTGGWLIVLLILPFAGIVLGWMWNFIQKGYILYNPIAIFVYFMLMRKMLVGGLSEWDLGILFCVNMLVYVIFIKLSDLFISNRIKL